MRFILTPAGSYGDVHPYVGIGRRLRERGHAVTVMTTEVFRDLVESAGLDFVCTWPEEEYYRVTRDPDLWHPVRGLRLLLRTVAGNLRHGYELLEQSWEPGAILVGHTLSFSTRIFEDRHGVPGATLQLAPSAIRSTYSIPPVVPGRDLAGWPRFVKRALLWGIDRVVIHPSIVPALNDFRRELGLKPVYRPFRDWLNSPRLVVCLFPDWFGRSQPDWPPQLVTVGFPLWDEADTRSPDAELEAFLDGCAAPPLVFTPGSAHRQASMFFAAAVGAAERLGRPAVLLTGFAEQLPPRLPERVHHTTYAPFSRVFPRAAAVVHHGGIGTLSQGLRAGVPQLAMPMSYDQPDNAAQLARLGVGDWLMAKDFEAGAVAAELERLIGDAEVALACGRYRELVAGTDAIGRTCELLEELGNRGR